MASRKAVITPIASLIVLMLAVGCTSSTQVSSTDITTVEQAKQAGWVSTSVPSAAMEPTIPSGSLVYGPSTGATQNRYGNYQGGSGDISVGDIVGYVDSPGRTNARRCVATAGQVVEIDDSGAIKVDGVVQDEPYVSGNTYPIKNDSGISYPYTVPEGYIFLLGDNRENASDSRYADPIDATTVFMIGKKVLNNYTNELEDIE